MVLFVANPSKRAGALLVILAAAALPSCPVAALDTECARFESGRRKMDWLHELPKADELPSPAFLEKAGAFILLDELFVLGSEKVFSQIVQVNDRAAIATFGDVTIRTQSQEYAEIRARILLPGGRVQEVEAAAIHCSLTRLDFTGSLIGKSRAPKQYVFHFPNLVPGAILHYQITLRTHERSRPDWGGNYNRLFRLYPGGQAGLGGDPALDARRQRYPAEKINFLFSVPHDMNLTAISLPAESALIYEYESADPFTEEIVQITGHRPLLPDETLAPGAAAESPWVLTRLAAAPSSAPETAFQTKQDWSDWVRDEGSAPYSHLEADELAALERATQHLAAGTPFEEARLLNRFLRDNPLFFQGLMKFGAPPDTPAMRAAALVHLLRIRGHQSGLLYVQTSGVPAVDRAVASGIWFATDRPQVLADIGGERLFFDPSGPSAAGRLPSFLHPYPSVGADSAGSSISLPVALRVDGPAAWEWIELPAATPEQHATRADIRIEGVEESRLIGRIEVEFTGAPAENMRRLAAWSPAEKQRNFDRLLDGFAQPGVRFWSAQAAGFGDADQPLRLSAGIEWSGARQTAQGWLLSSGMPVVLGPDPNLFGAARRVSDVDFKLPQLFECTLHIPRRLVSGLRVAPDAERSAPGLTQAWKTTDDADEYRLTSRRTAGGRVPAALYGDLQEFMREASATEEFTPDNTAVTDEDASKFRIELNARRLILQSV